MKVSILKNFMHVILKVFIQNLQIKVLVLVVKKMFSLKVKPIFNWFNLTVKPIFHWFNLTVKPIFHWFNLKVNYFTTLRIFLFYL